MGMEHRWHCRTCRHPEVAAIDRELRSGATREAVSRRYGVPYWSVRWHWERHLVTRYGGTELEREARAFTLDLSRLIREAERECREAERARRLGRYRRAWVRLRLYVQLRALSLGVPVRMPEPAELPLGRVRGGRLRRGKRLTPVKSTPAVAVDPLVAFRRQRREQLARLGVTDF